MLLTNTPIGVIQIPEWLEKELLPLTDEELLQKAVAENKAFVISPATFAMIERRQLAHALQKRINPHIGILAPSFKMRIKK